MDADTPARLCCGGYQAIDTANASYLQEFNESVSHVRPQPLAIDLFAGAGGLSCGFARAGFDIVQAVEKDARAADTYRHNHTLTDVIEADIEFLDPVACMRRINVRPGELTALMGGPPCQGFSESNRRTRTMSNPKNHLYTHMLRFIEAMQPAWVVIENVAGLRTMARGTILTRILGELNALGYNAEWRELNAVNYGVPQVRRRLFILASRFKDVMPAIPPVHYPECLPPISVRDAISDLPVIENGARIDELPYGKHAYLSAYQRLLRDSRDVLDRVRGNLVTRNASFVLERYSHIPQGGNWEDIPRELLSNYRDFTRCHTGIYHRLSWNSPAKVIGNFRKNMLIHPEQHRGLSIREAARLQSFPDSYNFTGLIESQQQQVADAVPPLLAAAVATALLDADEPSTSQSRLGFRRMGRHA